LVRASVQASTANTAAHQHGEDPVFLHGRIAQQPGALHGFGQRQRNLLRAPDDLDQLLADDHAAHGDENLLEVLAVDGPHDEALEGQAQGARHQHGHHHGRQHGHQVAPQLRRARPVAHGAEHAGGDEGAQRDEHAMAEVEHVHQAEHQGQARGDDEDDHAHGQARHRQREPGAGRAHQGR
jgi:hypothetical protein